MFVLEVVFPEVNLMVEEFRLRFIIEHLSIPNIRVFEAEERFVFV